MLLKFLLILLLFQTLLGFEWVDDRWDTIDKPAHFCWAYITTDFFDACGMNTWQSVGATIGIGVMKEFADGAEVFPGNSFCGSTEGLGSWRDMVANVGGAISQPLIKKVAVPLIRKYIIRSPNTVVIIPKEIRAEFVDVVL